MNKYYVGDVVRLKSDYKTQFPMTIALLKVGEVFRTSVSKDDDDATADVVWFDTVGHIHNGLIQLGAIESVNLDLLP